MEWFTGLGWFWKFWIISTAGSVLVFTICNASLVLQIKQEYVFVKQKPNTFKSISDWMQIAIPFYNVLLALIVLIGGNSLLEPYTEQLLKSGKIEKKKKEEGE